MTTELSLTIRTADKHIATELHNSLAQMVEGHINFTYYDGAWQLGLEADPETMKSIEEELTGCENYREGKFDYAIED